MEYLLDSNIFIEAQNRYYAQDICPGFWDWLNSAHAVGIIASITSVYDELAGKGDNLSTWIEERKGSGWFLDVSDMQTQQVMAEVSLFVATGGFKQHAIQSFLSGADPWLIAKAKATGATVVTHERYEPDAKRRVPIPNVCQATGVSYINTFDLLRRRGALFVSR